VTDKPRSVNSLAELHAKLQNTSSVVTSNLTASLSIPIPAESTTSTRSSPVVVTPVVTPVDKPANGNAAAAASPAPREIVGAGPPASNVKPGSAPALKTDTEAPSPFRVLRSKDTGVPRPCLANVLAFLRYQSQWLGVLAYNEFTDQIIVKREPPGWNHPKNTPWSDTDDTYAASWFQQNRMMVTPKVVASSVDVVARESSFHPVRDYLKRIRWDQKSRLESWLAKYMGAEDLPVNRLCGKMWLISAVARIFQPGAQVDHTLLLEGEQGIRKSTALRVLASDEWFTDHVSDFRDKDARIELRGKWIVELSELHGIKGKSLETVKSFLSIRIDSFRSPYGRRTEEHPRQCTFAATTNDFTSLSDESGNRRFWPVRCRVIDIPGLVKDRDQLWAEAYARYTKNEPWWPDVSQTSVLTEAQVARYEPGLEDDLIEEWVGSLPLYFKDDPADFYMDGSDDPILSRKDRVLVREVMRFALHAYSESGRSGAQRSVLRWLKINKWRLDRTSSRNFWTRTGERK
jgi:putative DNA primase/helicase